MEEGILLYTDTIEIQFKVIEGAYKLPQFEQIESGIIRKRFDLNLDHVSAKTISDYFDSIKFDTIQMLYYQKGLKKGLDS